MAKRSDNPPDDEVATSAVAEDVLKVLEAAGVPTHINDRVQDLLDKLLADASEWVPREPDPEADMNQIATEWAEARDVISLALSQVTGGRANQDHNAAAIIARLSHAGFSLEKVS